MPGDIFAIQDEVSAAITTALTTKLSGKPKGRKQYTPNVAAYEAYLRGTHYLWKGTIRENMERAPECYEEAIKLDSRFALSYSALAIYHHITASSFMEPREAVARGRENARKALDLDPSLPEANAWLGIFAVVYDLDWAEGNRRFQLAMARPPIASGIHHLY